MILFLTLLFTTVASKPADLDEMDVIGGDLLKLPKPALDLLSGMEHLIGTYNCDIGNAQCDAFKAQKMIDDLEFGKVNCDDGTNELLCSQAKQLVKAGEVASDEDIKVALLKSYETLLVNNENLDLLNAVSEAMENYICYKEPALCNILSEMEAQYRKFEKDAKPAV
ncbi:uncharacterized protein LOC134813358 [Bolinopsis microptera]|uniref:uncharacterized protein LOC134813358 n=1 Tax=Bolinopsis microptera TaxID=2820187 RepID=UPI003079030F